MPDATVPRNSSEAHRLLGRWDLGRKRSLDQLIAFTGVDSKNYKILFDNCGKRLYVPFDESMDDDEPHEEPLSGLGEEKEQHTAQQGGWVDVMKRSYIAYLQHTRRRQSPLMP
jgi:hypothetical protein